ncbi:hypothetical protein GCM10007147_43380 [Nocardiopsis kunsanensis]|uniref:Uncharacterized protein n=1 Tax=Nocardiopsis kunsanensis TaxID=141693 RepID=A0A918XLD2_9ACTN|nr:hypothetical protein GCM10007147_43380 [Nocardiopsis kunsanensis]
MLAGVASGAMTMTMWVVPVCRVRSSRRGPSPGTQRAPGLSGPGLLEKSSVSAQRFTGDRPGYGPVAIKAPKVPLHGSDYNPHSPSPHKNGGVT